MALECSLATETSVLYLSHLSCSAENTLDEGKKKKPKPTCSIAVSDVSQVSFKRSHAAMNSNKRNLADEKPAAREGFAELARLHLQGKSPPRLTGEGLLCACCRL